MVILSELPNRLVATAKVQKHKELDLEIDLRRFRGLPLSKVPSDCCVADKFLDLGSNPVELVAAQENQHFRSLQSAFSIFSRALVPLVRGAEGRAVGAATSSR